MTFSVSSSVVAIISVFASTLIISIGAFFSVAASWFFLYMELAFFGLDFKVFSLMLDLHIVVPGSSQMNWSIGAHVVVVRDLLSFGQDGVLGVGNGWFGVFEVLVVLGLGVVALEP
jgi:hypothetical protein